MKKFATGNSILSLAVAVLLACSVAAFAGGQFAKDPSNAAKQSPAGVSSAERAQPGQPLPARIIPNAAITAADTILHWDGDNNSGVGDGITEWRGMVVFTPTELGPFVGTHEITEVWAWMRSPLAWDSVLVEIYEGVTINPSGPSTINLGTKVYSQDFTAEVVLDNWTIHTLTSPVSLQSGQIYAVSIFIQQNQASPPAYPLGTDAGPMVPERGGWVWDPTLPNGAQLADFGINLNWNIRMGLSQTGSGGQTIVFEEGFEGAFPPANWVKINPDGGTGWDQVAIGTTPVPGWTGGVVTGAPNSGASVAFCTWNTGGAASNDQWLVTQQVSNVESNDSLHFWLRYWPNNYTDTLEVRISTTGNTNPADFNVLVATLGFGAGGDTSTAWNEYSYKVSGLVSAGANIYIAFRERVQDNFNNGSSFSLDNVSYTKEVTVGIGDDNLSTPASFSLRQNYPNPFNPSTAIVYDLAKNAGVTLKIYDLSGREVKTLVQGFQGAGTYTVNWNGTNDAGVKVASGIYLYRLEAGNFVQTRKMVLLK
ncbi:MAG: choice-of-anchor J domain-containing protein [Calditrichia bacterium]|nr:choice-of-anchor J domain-containing protein [Calditrichia bacterium]